MMSDNTSGTRLDRFIERNINMRYMNWQTSLLEDMWKISDSLSNELAEEFKKEVEKIDFNRVYESLRNAEIEFEIEWYAHHSYINSIMISKYKHTLSKTAVKEIKNTINSGMEEDIIQDIFKLFTEVPEKSKNFKLYGYKIFQQFIDFSEKLERRYSPETFSASLDQPKKEEPAEKEKGSKKERRAKALESQTSTDIEPILEGIPFSLHILLYTFLMKISLWHKLMKTPSTNKKNRIEYLSNWFRSFKQKYDQYIITDSCPYSLDLRELRGLRNKIYHNFEDNGFIFDMAESGDLEGLKAELDKGLDINMRNGKRKFKGLLHIAAIKENMELVELVERYGGDPNIVDRHVMTPLFFAIETKNLSIIKKLISMGTDIEKRDEHNATAIYWAIYSADLPVVKLLASFGADPTVICMMNRTCLLKAAFMDKWDMVEFLLGLEGANKLLNWPDQRGRTPLHAACWGAKGGRDGKRLAGVEIQDSPKSLRILLDHGADVCY